MSEITGLPSLFFHVHRDLPREGPGSDASTWRALQAAIPILPEPLHVIDVACGPGAQTLELARRLPDADITAIDLHGPFIAQLDAQLQAHGHSNRVHTLQADMRSWRPDAVVDMVWCEGAAYIMGVAAALRCWREWLVPGGVVALTEAVWLTDSPSEPASNMWAEYPQMGDVEACLSLFRREGYEPIESFVLPDSDWFDAYYNPMQARVDALRVQHADDLAAIEELAIHQEEIDVRRAHGEEYGYLFVIAQRL